MTEERVRDRHDIGSEFDGDETGFDLDDMEPTPNCTLNETEAEQRRAFFESELLAHLQGFDLLEDGFRLALAYSDEALSAATTLVRYENLCCSFAAFELSVPGDGETITLEMTGLTDVADALGPTLIEQLEAAGA